MTSYQSEVFFQDLERLVRESAYNVVRLSIEGEFGESYSRAFGLYDQACRLLRDWGVHQYASERVESFIRATYNPEVRS